MKTEVPSKTRQILFYILLLLGAIGGMWMLKKCSVPIVDTPTMHYEYSKGDTIDVAIEYSPMSMYKYADTIGGFNYDLMRLVADSAHIVVKFHPLVSLELALAGLDNGDFDVVVADIPMVMSYQQRYTLSEPVYLDKQVLVQRMDSMGEVGVKSQLDLAGKQVWVAAGSPVADRLRNLSAEIGDTIYVNEQSEYSPEHLFMLTAIGDIPLAVVNEKIALSMEKDYPDVDISTHVSFTQFQSWVMRKNDTLIANTINTILRRMKDSPHYHTLSERYLP